MNEKTMKWLNDDKRLKRIDNFEAQLQKTVIDNEEKYYVHFSEKIVVDKAILGEINKYSVQFLSNNYPDIEGFNEHITEMLRSEMIRCYAFFKDEYDKKDIDVEGNFISFDEKTGDIENIEQVLN